MITQTQMVAELQRRGYHVTERQLRDWRAKGLLPPLRFRSRGRGLGVVRYWEDKERILSQAMSVCDFLDTRGRAKRALLCLWFAGYEVNLETVRTLWLESLPRTRKVWVGNSLSKEECEYALGKLSHRLAKESRREAWGRALDLDLTDLEALLVETLNVCFNPKPEIAVDDAATHAARTILLRGTEAAASPYFMGRDDLERGLAFIRANLSIDAARCLISAATNEELRIAHSRWCSVGRIIKSLCPDGPTHLGTQLAIQFGGLCIFALLVLDRKGKGQWIDSHLEAARNGQMREAGGQNQFFGSGLCPGIS